MASDETPRWIRDMEPKRESIVDKMFPIKPSDPAEGRETINAGAVTTCASERECEWMPWCRAADRCLREEMRQP